MIIGGSFTLYNGTNRSCIARLNSDGNLDLGFNVGIGFNTGSPLLVDALALQSDGKLLVGGNFEGYNGASAESLARLNTDGSLDTTFDTRTLDGGGFTTFSVAPQPDLKVLIGGSFAEVKSIGHNRIARLNTNPSLDTTFDVGTGAVAPINPAVHSVVLQPDGNVILGGGFTTINRFGLWYVARVFGDAPVFNALSSSGGNFGLQWTAITGRTYRVQFKTNITSSDWFDLLPDIVASTNAASVTDPQTDPPSFLSGDSLALKGTTGCSLHAFNFFSAALPHAQSKEKGARNLFRFREITQTPGSQNGLGFVTICDGFVNGPMNVPLTADGAFVNGGKAVVNVADATGGFVSDGVVPFNACNTGNIPSKLSRTVTSAWNVGESISNTSVPIVMVRTWRAFV